VRSDPILPGGTIGFLGGGQLGRMAALAARDMGYDIRVLDPAPDCPACALATASVTAAYDDVTAITHLARTSQVLTIEIERVAVAGLEAAAEHVPVRPGAHVVEIVQHRERQKQWMRIHGFPIGQFTTATTVQECEAAVAALGPAYVKASTGGYDGRGQVLSVLVARRPSGDSAVFPVALNHHEAGQLVWSVIPAPIDPTLATRARGLGAAIAEAIDVVGLLAIEMFVLTDGTLLVNELAPRPHNSFHHTVEGCVTSQFEQLVRAICDLPLGATDIMRPAAIVNILGDVWQGVEPPDFAAALRVPDTRLHLYGKREARPARKMGHLAAVADTPIEARARVLEAARRLQGK
jgi:5-(carboxyamino)imidazole ribonucleotide synthase